MRSVTPHHIARRGVTSVLAMLFLVLFAALVIGFYAATTNSVQVANTDAQVAESVVAADSGMAFMRYQLAQLRIPAGTASNAMMQAIYDGLSSNLNGTANLGSNTVGFDGSTITIPSQSNKYVMLAQDAGRFRATITQTAGRVVVKITGRHRDDAVSRIVQMSFDASPRNGIFDYAIASRGKIATGGSSRVYGSPDKTTATILSANKVSQYPIIAGGKEIGGDVSIVNQAADVDVSGSSIGGSSDEANILANHVHKGVPEPEFPTIDISIYTQFVSKPYTDPSVQTRAAAFEDGTELVMFMLNGVCPPGGNGNGNGNGNGGNGNGDNGNGGNGGGVVYTNCYVPANANPTFNASDTIQGVLYIHAPNNVKINGGCKVKGVIVVENKTNLTPADTVIDFRGNVEAYGVETLDPIAFPQLRELTGNFILAENATVDFKGNFDSVVAGSIIAGSVSFGGSAGGSVNGSVIGMNAGYPMSISNSNSSPIIFVGNASTNPPSGTSFSSWLKADATSYLELDP